MTKKDLQKVLKEFLLKSKSSLITEETLTQTQLDKRQDYLKDLMKQKSSLIKRYGKDAEAVMYGRATNMAKKAISEMNKQKLKELVRTSLVKEDNNESSALFNDLEQKLKSHDWYYMMSDDNRKYADGASQQTEIRKLVKSLEAIGMGDEAKNLYNKYAPYREGGPDFRMKESKKSFPDLTGDGKVTKADVLKGRGVNIKENSSESGLMVIGRTPLDNNAIGDAIEEEGLYGEWNVREGYWFFPEEEDMYDNLEDQLSDLFNQKGINARFEGVFYESLDEDMDLGHEDNEPHMLKGDLYRIGKYAMELYQMVDQFEGQGEVDFPAWWQAKITKAKDMIIGAKHYLDFETKEPEIDAMMDAADDAGTFDNVGVEEPVFENEIGKDEELAGKIAKALKGLKLKDASYDSDKDNLQKARKALNKGDFNAAKKIANPYLEEKKLTKAEKNKKEDIVKGMKGNFKGDKAAMYAIATSKAKKVAENLTKQIKND
jgi:hypothetical protein